MANRDIQDAVTAARLQVEDFLAGRSSLVNAASALEILRKHDIDYLERLQTVMRGDEDLKRTRRDKICALASEAFEEYLSLEPRARAGSMPDIALHLANCGECSKRFSILEQSVGEINDDWVAFREDLVSARPPTLVGVRPATLERFATWVLSKSTGFLRPAGLGERLGEWLVGEMQPAGMRLAKVVETRSLRLALPQNSGTLIAWITPGPKGDLELEFQIGEQTSMYGCTIGVGNETGPYLGTRILPSKGRVRFTVDAPAREPYWIHLEWRMDLIQPWQKHKVLLPIIAEEQI